MIRLLTIVFNNYYFKKKEQIEANSRIGTRMVNNL